MTSLGKEMVLLVKTLHIVGVVLFLGAGLVSAWYKVRADRTRDIRLIAWCAAEIVRADWTFTVPAAVLVPTTGFLLVHLYGLPWTTQWVHWGIAGFLLAGGLWLPATWLQVQMRAMAEQALQDGSELPAAFRKANLAWFALGVPAFCTAVFTIWIMVTKWAP